MHYKMPRNPISIKETPTFFVHKSRYGCHHVAPALCIILTIADCYMFYIITFLLGWALGGSEDLVRKVTSTLIIGAVCN